MDIFSIIILGLTQGITEWVPISSKTQDTLVYVKFLGGDPAMVIPVLLYLHIGTVLAATIYFRKEIAGILNAIVKKPTAIGEHARSKPGFLFTALLFTGVVGVPLLLVEKIFFPSMEWGLLLVLMGAGLVLTGFFLSSHKGIKIRTVEEVGWKDGVLTGILQGLSVLPGVSRSGTSTTGLIWREFDSESSFYLSFLLSIPTVIMAELVFYVGGAVKIFPVSDGILLALSSFFFGYITLDSLLRIVKRVNLAYFAAALGLIMIAAGLLGAG